MNYKIWTIGILLILGSISNTKCEIRIIKKTNGLNISNICRSEILFDDGWNFHRGDAIGANRLEFNDSHWQLLDLPHDWSIENLPGTNSPFSHDAISEVGGGFTTGGTGWYRKSFVVSEQDRGKRIVIQFDGIYMNPEIWINGICLGNHPYGYTSFYFDITDKLKYGQTNILAVKVRNEGVNSRWYSGSGINRHVWLKSFEPVHIVQWGSTVSTSEINDDKALLKIETKVNNQSNNYGIVKLITRIINGKGKEIAMVATEQPIKKDSTCEFAHHILVSNPELWSVEHPALYLAVNEVYFANRLVDQTKTKFGIRTIKFNTENGLLLNDKSIKLKGGCFHIDNGPLGTKSYDRAEERKIELLKASGFNAIRCSHNPPSPALLDACDRMGMLVIDEAFDMWKDQKNPDDYHLYFNDWWQKDLESMVLRDRNHPSVIMWSIGNEIPNRDKPEVVRVAKMLGDYIRLIDPSRLITSAVNDLKPDKDPYFATIDVAGYNYGHSGENLKNNIYEQDHQRVPQRVMYGSESYPLESYGAWMNVIDYPYVIGDFVWTAFDYIGEASIGWRGYPQEKNFYPWNLAYCGDIDICGWKRPQSYYRDALWMSNQLSIFVKSPNSSFETNPKREEWSKWHWFDVVAGWNWEHYKNSPLEVIAYSSCEQVELFLDNQSFGKIKTDRSTMYQASWMVPYQAGELKAIGYIGGKQVNSKILRTAEEPTQIRLSADRTELKANREDLSYITVELLDKFGTRNPKAENLVKFDIEGPGKIIGVGNAMPTSTESYQLSQRKAWQGKCLVIIKSCDLPGSITLNAKSQGLKSARIFLKTE